MGLVSLGACVAGFVLDFIFGDPVWLYHPVRLIGKWISFLEKLLRRKTGEKGQIAAGGILWILTVGIWCDGRDLVDRTEMESGSRIHTGDILVLSDFCSQMSCQRKRKGL